MQPTDRGRTACIVTTVFLGFFLPMSAHAQEHSPASPGFSDPRFDPAEVLDAESFPDAPWSRALQSGDRREAVKRFVRELREGEPRIDLEESIPVIRQRWFGQRINAVAGMDYDADDVVELRYHGAYGIVHQFEGEIDWTYDPTNNRTPEWTWGFNRHLHWLNLADAYRESGEARYAEAWERELRSWIRQAPRPEGRGRERGSPWRTLDTGIRAGSTWPYAFEIFRKSRHVTDEALWLFYCAQLENARHLLRHPAGGNWLVMETNGLGQAGLMLRETAESDEFIRTALRRMEEELDRQFFPDGTHQEFAPHYAAAGCLANFYVLAWQARKAGYELPEGIWDMLANIALALARIADPDGVVPGLHNSRPFSVQGLYDDFSGRLPQPPPWTGETSDHLPYGGYAVFRRPDRFSLFDAGPRGTSHFHDDDLQLITWAFGHHFTIDPGSPLYTDEAISRHLRSSAAHNVVQLEGKLHKPAILIPRPREPMPLSFHGKGRLQAAAARRPLVTSDEERFEIERVVLELDGFGWLVLDRLFPPDDSPHSWEWIWNLLVDEVTHGESDALASHKNGPAMRLAVSGPVGGRFEVSSGTPEPELRGWINRPGSDDYTSIPALRFLSEEVTGNTWLCTVKVPFPDANDPAPVEIIEAVEEKNGWSIAVRKGDDSYRFQIAAANGQVRGAEALKNGSELGRVRFAESHVLRETE